jgi:hypothetical protein
MPQRFETRALTMSRHVVAGTAAVIASIVWTHALAGVLRHLGPEGAPLAALPLTLAAAVAVVLGVFTWSSRRSLVVVAAAAAIAIVSLQAAFPGSWSAALALGLSTTAASELGRVFARRLPPAVDAIFARRSWAVLFLVLSAIAIVQVGRLSTFMTDPDSDWFLSTRHPFWAKHECLPAYLYGAELNERGAENVYDPDHYPALNPAAEAATSLAGMAPEDPYQYAPQFLLFPRLAIAVIRDYPTIRAVWFGLQTTLLLVVAGWLTVWVGGRRGLLAGLSLPLVLSAFPTLHALQYGQFHLAAVALGVAAMLAFAAHRRALGGALLATATLSKLFPGLLLIVLVAQRRWRDLAWAGAFMLALTIAAWAVLGPAPFVAFVDYHLPRLSSGGAFAFGEVWPEIRTLIIADNQGAYGLVEKLGEMGVPGIDRTAAARVGKLFGLAVAGLAALFAFRSAAAPRDLRAAGWLAILGLGSMASAGAFGDYVPLTAVWMMTVLTSRVADRRWLLVPFAIAGLFQYFILGTTPIGEWSPPEVMIPLSAAGVVLALGLYAWSVGGAMGFRVSLPKVRPLRSLAPRSVDILAVAGAPARSVSQPANPGAKEALRQ